MAAQKEGPQLQTGEPAGAAPVAATEAAGGAAAAPGGDAVAAPASSSSTVSEASAGDDEVQGRAAAVARYWWCLGRLREAAGDAAAAARAYTNCAAALAAPGCRACSITLPHCASDGAIGEGTVAAKLELLRVHALLAGATVRAAAGAHADVVGALAPALLSCNDQEAQLLALDRRLWLRGLELLLAAAGTAGARTGEAAGAPASAAAAQPGGAGGWRLALRCHLRLLAALLPPVPTAVAPLLGGEDVWEAAARTAAPGATARAAAAALRRVAEGLAASAPASAALEAAAAFLGANSELLSGEGGVVAEEGPLALHPAELAMLRTLQRQLLVVVQACALAACAGADGGGGGASRLSSRGHALRTLAADAATCALALGCCRPAAAAPASPAGAAASDAAPMELDVPGETPAKALAEAAESAAKGDGEPAALQQLPVAAAAELAWALCEALGVAGALLARGGAFVRACMTALRRLSARLEHTQRVAAAAAAGSGKAEQLVAREDSNEQGSPQAEGEGQQSDGEPTPEQLAAFLRSGLRHCLLWLFGLELPAGGDDEDWGGGFQVSACLRARISVSSGGVWAAQGYCLAAGSQLPRSVHPPSLTQPPAVEPGSESASPGGRAALSSAAAVAEVWPLVAPALLEEAAAGARHVAKHRGERPRPGQLAIFSRVLEAAVLPYD